MGFSEKILKWVDFLGTPVSSKVSDDDSQFVESLSSDDQVSLDVARATLLVDLALIDSKFDAREKEFIINTLMYDLGTSKQELDGMIKNISSTIQFRGSYSMAVELRNRLPQLDREKIAVELEQLLVADSVKDGFEIYLIKKLKDLLGVD